MSAFNDARDLLRASIVSNFGSEFVVTLPEGEAQPVQGYVKAAERERYTALHFFTDVRLPPHSTLEYLGKTYALAFSNMAKGRNKAQSQIMREYVMSKPQEGERNGWSEFENVG